MLVIIVDSNYRRGCIGESGAKAEYGYMSGLGPIRRQDADGVDAPIFLALDSSLGLIAPPLVLGPRRKSQDHLD